MRQQRTVCIGAYVGHQVAHADIDDTKETLVLLLELFLVKDLDGEDAALVGSTAERCQCIVRHRWAKKRRARQAAGPQSRRDVAYKSKLSFQYGFSVLLLTLVVLVCSPLRVATAKGSGKPIKGQ